MRVKRIDGKAYVSTTEVYSMVVKLAERDRRIQQLENLLAAHGVSMPAVSTNTTFAVKG